MSISSTLHWLALQLSIQTCFELSVVNLHLFFRAQDRTLLIKLLKYVRWRSRISTGRKFTHSMRRYSISKNQLNSKQNTTQSTRSRWGFMYLWTVVIKKLLTSRANWAFSFVSLTKIVIITSYIWHHKSPDARLDRCLLVKHMHSH